MNLPCPASETLLMMESSLVLLVVENFDLENSGQWNAWNREPLSVEDFQ